MRYTRDHLVRIDDDQFFDCVLCGPIESDIHEESCPFHDLECDRIIVSASGWVILRSVVIVLWMLRSARRVFGPLQSTHD